MLTHPTFYCRVCPFPRRPQHAKFLLRRCLWRLAAACLRGWSGLTLESRLHAAGAEALRARFARRRVVASFRAWARCARTSERIPYPRGQGDLSITVIYGGLSLLTNSQQ